MSKHPLPSSKSEAPAVDLSAELKKAQAALAQERKDCVQALADRDRYGLKWREHEIECNRLRADLKQAREALKVAEHFFQSPTSFSAKELCSVANTVSLALDPENKARWHFKSYLVWASEQAPKDLGTILMGSDVNNPHET